VWKGEREAYRTRGRERGRGKKSKRERENENKELVHVILKPEVWQVQNLQNLCAY
jgi:hypothetical protein